MNNRILPLPGLILSLALVQPADAQFGLGGLIQMPASGEATGKYRKGNEIRARAQSGAYGNFDLYGAVIQKLAELSREKGYPRFALKKVMCGTMLMNGSPHAKTCNIIGQMVGIDESLANPKGKEIEYYLVSDVLK